MSLIHNFLICKMTSRSGGEDQMRGNIKHPSPIPGPGTWEAARESRGQWGLFGPISIEGAILLPRNSASNVSKSPSIHRADGVRETVHKAALKREGGRLATRTPEGGCMGVCAPFQASSFAL